MGFYYTLGYVLGIVFFGTMVIYFVVIPIVVICNLLSIPAPKIKDRDWKDIFAVDK